MNALALLPTFVVLLLLVTTICLPANANAEKTGELEFNEILKVVLAKYMKEDEVNKTKEEGEASDGKNVLAKHVESNSVEDQTAELPFVGAAQLLREIEENFVENLAKQCAEKIEPRNWQNIFLSLHDNFRALTGQRWPEDDRLMKNAAEENSQLVQLLLSFAVQMGYTVGAQALKGENGGKEGGIQLGRFVKVFNCLDEKIKEIDSFREHKINKLYLSATFVTKDEEKVLVIKFDGENTDNKEKRAQRQFNFDVISFLLSQAPQSIGYLSGMIKIFVNWPWTENYYFSRGLNIKDKLVMAWKGINDQKYWNDDEDENLLYLLKRFSHGLARKLLDSEELNDGYFQLHPQEKAELEGYWKKLKADLPQRARKAKLSAADNEHAHFHYEDAILFDWKFFSEELNLLSFNKRIRLLLAQHTSVDYNKETNSSALAMSVVSARESAIVVEMSVANAAELVNNVERTFVTESLKEHCHENFYYKACEEELAKFRHKFHTQTGGDRIGVEAFSRDDEQLQLSVQDDARTLKLLLSFVIRIGFTLGSKAMGLEYGRFNQLLVLHSYLQKNGLLYYSRNDDKSIYAGAQFLHTEGKENFYIIFEFDSDNIVKFKMLNEMTEMKKQSVGEIIELLQYLDKKKPNEPFEIGLVEFSFGMTMQSLMEMWTGAWGSCLLSDAALYQMKLFGRDLGQHLLDAKEEEDFFRLFPDAKGKIIEKLVSSLGNDMQECQKRSIEDIMTRSKNKYYKMLELEPGCEREQINQAYRRMALKLHPDKHPVENMKEVKEKFEKVKEAVDFLRDEAARTEYEEEIVKKTHLVKEQDNQLSSYMHYEEMIPVEFRMESNLVKYVHGSVLRDVIGARKCAVIWHSNLEEMNEQTCGEIIWDIFSSKNIFDIIVGYGITRFDDSVDSALNMFFSHDSAKQIYVHGRECNLLKFQIENLKKTKLEHQEEGSQLKNNDELEQKLKATEAELQAAKEALKHLCVEFMAEQKNLLVEQAKAVVDALVNLEMKANTIVVDQMGKQVAEQEKKCEELEGKIGTFKNHLEMVKQEHKQEKEGQMKNKNMKKELAEVKTELVEMEKKLNKVNLKNTKMGLKQAERRLKYARNWLEQAERKLNMKVTKEIEEIGELRNAEMKIIKKAKKNSEGALKKLEKAEKKLEDAEKKLEDAVEKIQTERKLNKAEKEKENAELQLENVYSELWNADGKFLIAERVLEDAEMQETAKMELSKVEENLEKAEEKLTKSKKELKEANLELKRADNELKYVKEMLGRMKMAKQIVEGEHSAAVGRGEQ